TWYLAAGLAVCAFLANISLSSPSAAQDTLRIESQVENTVIPQANTIPTQDQIDNQVQSIQPPATEEGGE
ncbi:MAG: hypothetical protein AAFN10_08595, partial [Bacteroidota bacterium]